MVVVGVGWKGDCIVGGYEVELVVVVEVEEVGIE